jgi:hypothetical protein
MSLAFFLAALGEELGWSGYIIDPMQDRWGALPAAIFLGLLWAIWHIVPLVQAHRSPIWIAWWSLGTVAARILIVWLYNNMGKSVFAATAFHTMMNISWQLFPINGSYFDPRINGLMMVVAAAFVIAVWVHELWPCAEMCDRLAADGSSETAIAMKITRDGWRWPMAYGRGTQQKNLAQSDSVLVRLACSSGAGAPDMIVRRARTRGLPQTGFPASESSGEVVIFEARCLGWNYFPFCFFFL